MCMTDALARSDRLGLGLPEGHVLRELIEEHEGLLELLRRLEVCNDTLQSAPRSRRDDALLDLVVLVHALRQTEGHRRREEELVFPELAAAGVRWPSEVLEREHARIAALVERLRRLAVAETPALDAIDEAVADAVVAYRVHISTEEEALLPAAIALVPLERWLELSHTQETCGTPR